MAMELSVMTMSRFPKTPPTPKTIEVDNKFKLQHLRLRKIIKENHNEPIRQIRFNMLEGAGCKNILGTVGGHQFSMYDNEHCGDHLDIVSNFANFERLLSDEEQKRFAGRGASRDRVITSFSWLKIERRTIHIALGSYDHNIYIIDLSMRRVEKILKGHGMPVLDICPLPNNNNILASTGNDKVLIWDVTNGTCIAFINKPATRLIFHPSGSRFLTASLSELREWNLNMAVIESFNQKPYQITELNSKVVLKRPGCTIDDMRYVGGNLLLYSSRGRLEMYDPVKQTTLTKYKMNHPNVEKSGPKRFGLSPCGQFVCAGNNRGGMFVWEVKTGDIIGKYSNSRSKTPILDTAFTHDCRSIVSGNAAGCILRWDYCVDSRKRKGGVVDTIHTDNQIRRKNESPIDKLFSKKYKKTTGSEDDEDFQ